MVPANHPALKAVYIQSHIRALFDERGQAAVDELQRRYGKLLSFESDEYVPVRVEVEILGHIVDICTPKKLSSDERALLAGRLAFKNFTSSFLWRTLMPLVRTNPKAVLMRAHYIASQVFQGIVFTPEDTGATTVKMRLENNDYPLEYFQGFFEEGLMTSRLTGAVEADTDSGGAYIYTITWR